MVVQHLKIHKNKKLVHRYKYTQIKLVSEMTYNLLMGMLNPTNSLTTQIKRERQTDRQTDREENHKTSSLHAQSAPYSTAQICSNARSRFAREKEKFWPYCLADAIGDSYMEAKSGYLVKVQGVNC